MFTPWTMKSSQVFVNYVIGYWIRLGTSSLYTKENIRGWPWSLRCPIDIIFKVLHFLLTWSNMFCSGRGKRGALVENDKGPMAKKCCYNKISMKVSFEKEKMKTREDKQMVKLNFFSFQNWLFGAYIIKKISTIIFWCTVIPRGPHLVFTEWGAQRPCKLSFQDIGAWKWDHQVKLCKKDHFPWSDFTVHGVNRLPKMETQAVQCL